MEIYNGHDAYYLGMYRLPTYCNWEARHPLCGLPILALYRTARYIAMLAIA